MHGVLMPIKLLTSAHKSGHFLIIVVQINLNRFGVIA
jgi:hypothetical protein